MKYRIATVEDCAALTRLRMDMRKERDSDFREETLYANTLAFFQNNIAKGTHVAFLCEEAGAIIGTAGLTLFEMPPTSKLPNGKVAKLMNMYTIPAYRKQGVAKGMLDFVMDYAKEHGYYKIMLNSSPMGRPLYERAGFALIPNEYDILMED